MSSPFQFTFIDLRSEPFQPSSRTNCFVVSTITIQNRITTIIQLSRVNLLTTQPAIHQYPPGRTPPFSPFGPMIGTARVLIDSPSGGRVDRGGSAPGSQLTVQWFRLVQGVLSPASPYRPNSFLRRVSAVLTWMGN